MAVFRLSKSKLRETYDKIKELGVTISYSHKTNREVGKLLETETDCYFNIHSFASLKNVENKDRVWYFPLSHTKEEFLNLLEFGVNKFVIDNEYDLNNLIDLIEIQKKQISILFRMKLKENTVKTGKYYVFGLDSKKVNELIEKYHNHELIKQIGIHVHRKTQNIAEWSLVDDIVSTLTAETYQKIQIVNIGGGLPSTYKNTNERTIDYISNKIKELVEHCKKNSIEVHAEPGRALAAPCIKLASKIIAIHDKNLIVDASVYNSSVDTLIADVKLVVENELEKSDYQYLIKGRTPCSMDIFRYRVNLQNPKIGDEIVFLNAGAYNYTTDFCSLERIPTEVVE